MSQTGSTLRIGLLGAARIAPSALLRPARQHPEVTVTAVAARDVGRAGAFAEKQRIPRVLQSYDELVADPQIDPVYNPLPNGLHGRWTLAALAVGKHVLCEKPFADNSDEAAAVADVAEASSLVVMEAFHYHYHSLVPRLLDEIAAGRLGDLVHVEVPCTDRCRARTTASTCGWPVAPSWTWAAIRFTSSGPSPARSRRWSPRWSASTAGRGSTIS